ncbi:glycerol-3-phosphate 1-O-acyltransferase PlsY [Fonticella tunisiensis]|uniref:Glycerol-3-phosphate acyltransferase n=1 Tax=Fonticella tunisiensis TaxID=1096341 RepID=A0A4R7KPV5_9CLOT|nr:glycerol-3-phosphate 1-O-acyltransferase PlsY [Fonticella tunisiensis]TDT61151.1 acyl-phosphate glycerol-3-phosphate acyltransferase [Fonticella tunisiensis]
MQIIFFIIISYIVGSIPTALIIGLKFFNKDIRNYGSKNLGGTNAGRVLGKTVGIVVSAIDVAKVFVPAYIAKRYIGINGAAIAGFFGMIGHCYPLFAQFKGGKAVSSFFGIVLAINLTIAAILATLWFILRYITNYVSVASMISGFVASFMFLFTYGFSIPFYVLFMSAIFVVYRHKSNIERLIKGTENKFRNK